MNTKPNTQSSLPRLVWSALFIAAVTVPAFAAEHDGAKRWYRGNTHTHTWWSDGDSPPEVVVDWYRSHGYHFLVLTDHNEVNSGESWAPNRDDGARRCEERFGPGWMVKRERDGKTEYRLKTLPELKSMFEKPGEFLLIPGEEITSMVKDRPAHLNAINLKEVIKPPKGLSFIKTAQKDIDLVLDQAKQTGQPMLVHLNHPNWKWGFTIEDMLQLKGLRFFEVFNGGGNVHNEGNEQRPSTDRMWDVLLTKRLAEKKMRLIYGVAADDAHRLNSMSPKGVGAARGWIMVRAARLGPAALIDAMNRGDFYASTGVTLDDIRYEARTLSIDIHPEAGVNYRTQFIGTLRGYDGASTSQPAIADEPPVSYNYSNTIGKVLAEVEGVHPSYKVTGEEIYVRAKVISTREHRNQVVKGELECAWVQPFVPEPIGR